MKLRAVTRVCRNAFFVRVINDWNSLSSVVVDANILNQFKNRLDTHWADMLYTIPYTLGCVIEGVILSEFNAVWFFLGTCIYDEFSSISEPTNFDFGAAIAVFPKTGKKIISDASDIYFRQFAVHVAPSTSKRFAAFFQHSSSLRICKCLFYIFKDTLSFLITEYFLKCSINIYKKAKIWM